ncbi:MAG: hypothetical protein AABX83_03570 [Nanoarchaeota archaeon]|mgnify:CR=1 FL=1
MNFGYKPPVELELYEKVGDRVKELMHTKGFTVRSLAQKLKDESVFQSYSTAKRFIMDIRNGYINLLIGNYIGRSKSKLDSNLERIAYIFSTVGIGSEEEAIRIVKNKNPGFVYPLKQD